CLPSRPACPRQSSPRFPAGRAYLSPLGKLLDAASSVPSAARLLLTGGVIRSGHSPIAAAQHRARATTLRTIGPTRLLTLLCFRRRHFATRNVILNAAWSPDADARVRYTGGCRSADCTDNVVMTEISGAIDHLIHRGD